MKRIRKDNFQKLQNTILKISIWGVLGNLIFLMQGMESSVLWMPEDQVLSNLEARPSMMVLQIEIMMILVAWTLYRGVQSYLEQAPGSWAISSLVESGLALGTNLDSAICGGEVLCDREPIRFAVGDSSNELFRGKSAVRQNQRNSVRMHVHYRNRAESPIQIRQTKGIRFKLSVRLSRKDAVCQVAAFLFPINSIIQERTTEHDFEA